MDDDIFAALGASGDDEGEDDIFSAFSSDEVDEVEEDLFKPVDIARSEAEASIPSSDEGDEPEWLTDTFGDFEDAQSTSNIASGAFDEESGGFLEDGGPFAGLASSGRFLGMTPMQRMVLSIFLFVDVSILGCLLLVAIGALQF